MGLSIIRSWVHTTFGHPGHGLFLSLWLISGSWATASQTQPVREVLVGQVVSYDLPGVSTQATSIRLDPPEAGRVHVVKPAQQPEKSRLVVIFNKPGSVRLMGLPKGAAPSYFVKAWPAPPPPGGVVAGIGRVAGSWSVIETKPQVGEILRLTLTLKGDAALAIQTPPKAQVQAGQELAKLQPVGQDVRWPNVSGDAEVFFKYEFACTNSIHHRVLPLVLHSFDTTTQQVQSRIISGPAWQVEPRPMFQAEVAQVIAATKNQSWPNWWPALLALLLLPAFGLFYKKCSDPFRLIMQLSLTSRNPSPEMALQLYRRLEPAWLRLPSVGQQKRPPRWRAMVQSRMEALARQAFGPRLP